MPSFEYFMVLPGVVAALALGRLLRGAAIWVQSPREQRYTLYLAWTAILFMAQIVAWQAASNYFNHDISETPLFYLSFFAFPASIYLASSVLSPEEASTCLCAHYHKHAKRFFVICTAGLFLATITNIRYPHDMAHCLENVLHWKNVFRLENALRFGGAICTAVLAWFSNGDCQREQKQLHYSMTAVLAALFIVFICLSWLVDH